MQLRIHYYYTCIGPYDTYPCWLHLNIARFHSTVHLINPFGKCEMRLRRYLLIMTRILCSLQTRGDDQILSGITLIAEE